MKKTKTPGSADIPVGDRPGGAGTHACGVAAGKDAGAPRLVTPNTVLLLLIFLCTVLPCNAQELRWGGDAEGGAPYLLPDPKNPRRIIGFEIDLMEALAKQLNRKSVFVQNQWDGLIPGLQRGS